MSTTSHCHGGVCTLPTKAASPKAKPHTSNNCLHCHDETIKEFSTGSLSLNKKRHELTGHQCADRACNIHNPHSHNRVKIKDEHKHEHNHDHKDKHKEHNFPLWPLEDFIAHTKLPQTFKEFLLNTSFLSPAMLVSYLLSKVKLPQIIKTWTAIGAMHLLNRGNNKLARLGLTFLVSGAATNNHTLAQTTSGIIGTGSNLSRFIATSFVAIIEKMGDLTNLRSKKHWQEIIPSLINIETKVQIIAPLVSNLINKVSSSRGLIGLVAKVIGTSLSFVGTDKILQALIKGLGVKDTGFGSAIGSVCGCCGSPVCAAAATDTALSNSF